MLLLTAGWNISDIIFKLQNPTERCHLYLMCCLQCQSDCCKEERCCFSPLLYLHLKQQVMQWSSFSQSASLPPITAHRVHSSQVCVCVCVCVCGDIMDQSECSRHVCKGREGEESITAGQLGVRFFFRRRSLQIRGVQVAALIYLNYSCCKLWFHALVLVMCALTSLN